MKINGDFFIWLSFIIKLIRLFIELFGDPDEQEVAKNNHIEVNSKAKS